jgi:uncharacterized protein (DUF433 family)
VHSRHAHHRRGVLGSLSAGQSRETILQDYPYLESADIDAVLAFAARQAIPYRDGIEFLLSQSA